MLHCRDLHSTCSAAREGLFAKQKRTAVSSGYNDTSECSIATGSSLIYTRNNNGPKMLPCGTPKVTGRASPE